MTTAREKVAAYIKKAAITVAQGEDEQGFHMLVTMNGREYVLRGDAAEKFRQEYATIKKPEAAVNQLVEKYMNDLKPYKKPTIQHPTPVKEQAEGLADADAYWAGKEKEPGAAKRYMTQHASKTASAIARKVASGSQAVLGASGEGFYLGMDEPGEGSKVIVKSLGVEGTIKKIRKDDRGEEIFDIKLDDPSATPDGMYIAREFELETAGDPMENMPGYREHTRGSSPFVETVHEREPGGENKEVAKNVYGSKKIADGERKDDIPVSEGTGDSGKQPKSNLSGAAPEALPQDWAKQEEEEQEQELQRRTAEDLTSSVGLFSELGMIAASLTKTAYVSHCPGHRNSEGELAEWCVKKHNTDKILTSYKSEEAAKEGLKNMEIHKGSQKASEKSPWECSKCHVTYNTKPESHNCKGKTADAAPVLPGNLKHPESANVNAMREALETQAEMEVGKPIQEKQVEVQNAEKDSGQELHVPGVGEVESKEIVIPKDETQSRQVIINIAKQKVNETNAKMKAASASNKPITNDGAGGAMGGTDIDAHTPQISTIQGAGERPGSGTSRPLVIAELQALPIGGSGLFGSFNVHRDTSTHYTVFDPKTHTSVMQGTAQQVLSLVPQAQAPQEQSMIGSDKKHKPMTQEEKEREQKAKALGLKPGVKSAEEKVAGFNYYFPGQALREFYPEIQHELVDYPNANNAPMIEDIDISQGYDNDIAAAADEALDVTKLSYVSTSPAAGAGIGRDGKPEVLEGAPLRKENDIRGMMFMDEFYQNYDAGPDGSALSIVSKKVAAAEEAGQFGKFLIKVCAEIAAALVSGFKVTNRPLMDKIPGKGEVQLAQVEKAQPGFMALDMSLIDTASRVKYLLEKLTDSEIQNAINGAYAQSGVWHDKAKGGFVYEVFVRANSIDTDTMVMRYEFVCGTKEAQ